MAKKAELYAELKKLDKKTTLTDKNTIAEIKAELVKVKASQAETEEPQIDAAETTLDTTEKEEHYAKSGKKSKKHEEEVVAKEEKEARKAAHDTAPQGEAEAAVKKGDTPKTRPLVERRGKNYKTAHAKVEKGKAYPVTEAMALAIETTTTKFDSTVELHVRLGVDPKQADQNIRSTVTLPHGTGKTVRVAAFVPDADVKVATDAGADIAGEEATVSLLDKETIDFDVLIATPTLMPKLGKYARLLGPRGLMPNPKSGTVSTNPAQAVKDAKGGKVEYRVDKQAIIHIGIGKASFGADKLTANAKHFLDSLNSVKPSSLKGSYILSIHASTTMGPGIKVEA